MYIQTQGGLVYMYIQTLTLRRKNYQRKKVAQRWDWEVVARTVARLSHWVYFNSRLKVTKESCWRDLFFVCREWALGENTHICIKRKEEDSCLLQRQMRSFPQLQEVIPIEINLYQTQLSTYRSWQKTGMDLEEPKWSRVQEGNKGFKNASSLP